MGYDEAIKQTCLAARHARISLGYLTPRVSYVAPESLNYDRHCRWLFSGAMRWQMSRGFNPPKIWSPDHIEVMKAGRLQYNVPMTFAGPEHRYVSTPFSAGPDGLYFGAAIYAEMETEVLQFGIDHEVGHMRDRELMKRFRPELSNFFDTDDLYKEERVPLVEAYLNLFEQNIPDEQKLFFREQAQDVFGNPEDIDMKTFFHVYRILSELLRYGEEILDPRLRDEVMFLIPTPPTLSKVFADNNNSEQLSIEKPLKPLTLRRLLMIAYLQEGGVWEEFKTKPDFDPTAIAKIDLNHLTFFRMCIRAASKYFPAVYSERTLPKPTH